MPIDLTTCSCCSSSIEDELLQNRFCQPDFPDIPLGPFCRNCLSKIRVCSGCQHAFEVDNGITYFGKGNYYCKTCAENIEACGICSTEGTIAHVIDGVKWCSDCYNKEFRNCNCCDTHVKKSNIIRDPLDKAQYKGLFKKYPSVCKSCFIKNKSRFKKHDVKKCPSCERLHSEDMKYCKRCWDNFKTCSCGVRDHLVKKILVSKKNGEKKNLNKCAKCRAKYTKCKACNSFSRFTIKSGKVLTEAELCPTCISHDVEQCSSCLGTHELLKSGVCHNCSEAYKRNVCTVCGRTKDQDGRCRICERSRVYNYSLKPHPKFHYTDKDISNREKLFFGIENESHYIRDSSSNEALKDIYEQYGPQFVLAKDDSSISSPGFEVVTQPMTLDYFNKKDLSGLFHEDLRVDRSCGMHVHVSREAFNSDLHIFKVVDFIHDHVRKIDKVVGRSYNGFNEGLRSKASKTVKDAKRGSANRGSRVNLSNLVTIEFRMFANCAEEYTMRYRIEFLHALVKWSAISSISNSKSWDALVRYINSNKKMYSNIIRFLGTM